MAGKFEITFSEVLGAADFIEQKNQEFLNKVNEMEGYRSELAGMWEGAANTAFNNAVTQDKEKWTQFSTLLGSYASSLRQVAQKLQQAEAENQQTAATRSY